MIRAICFDFDGTLVDSEQLHYAAWQAELQPFGCSLEKSRYLAQISGVSTYATANTLIDDYQLPISTEQLMAQKTDRFLFLLKTELPTPMPGADQLLRDMQQSGLTVALVTGSYRKEIEPMLAHLGWRDCFSLIITRDDVQNGKPHPEPYLTALERLNLPAEACLALEDSATGIRSAHDAGLTVFAITTPHTNLAPDVGYSALFYSLSAVGDHVRQSLLPPKNVMKQL
jgi:beta-phosphoglucomutase